MTLRDKFRDAFTAPDVMTTDDLMQAFCDFLEQHFAQHPAAKPDGLTVEHVRLALTCACLSGGQPLLNDSGQKFTIEQLARIVITGEAAMPEVEDKYHGYALSESVEALWEIRAILGPSDLGIVEQVRKRFESEKPAGAEVEFDRHQIARKWRNLNRNSPFSDSSKAEAIDLAEWALATFKPSPQAERVMPSDEAISAWLSEMGPNVVAAYSKFEIAKYAAAHFSQPTDPKLERLRRAVLDGALEVRGLPTMGSLPWQRFWHATDEWTAYESARGAK